MGYEDVDYCLRAWQARLRGGLRAVGATPPPRVDHPRHLRRRTRAQVTTGLLASLGNVLRRAPGPERRRQAAGRLRGAGHDRVRRRSEWCSSISTASPSAATTPSCGRWEANPTGSSSAARCGASPTTTRSSRHSRRCRRSRSRPGGRPPPRSGARASSTVCRSTSSRTSRPATTPKSPCADTRCSPPIGPSLGSSPPRPGIKPSWRSWGWTPTLISPGVDLDTFRPLPDVARRDDMLLALGRSNPLKNLRLTLDAWRRLPHPRPELCLFGSEPELAREPGIRYVTAPSDREVNELLNQATAFLQTSTHEGFCLTILEAMATGCPVVCTDADGNRDFCVERRELPDARSPPGRCRRRRRPAARRPSSSLAASVRPASPRPALTPGARASTRWSGSCSRSRDPGNAVVHGRRAGAR